MNTERIKMKFEFIKRKGILTGIKVVTTETIKSRQWEGDWIDGRYLELLLNLDSEWRTLRRAVKGIETPPMDEVRIFIRHLVSLGLVEKRKRSKSHIEYRRTYAFPKHSLSR